MNILLAGCGNLTEALFGDLSPDLKERHRWWTYTPSYTRASTLAGRLSGTPIRSLDEVDTSFDLIYLGMKPQQFSAAAPEIRRLVGQRAPLIVSVLASTPTDHIRSTLGGRVLRLMPNTAVQVSRGSTLAFKADSLSSEETDWATALFHQRSLLTWVEDEGLFDLLTAPSGSLPGLFFRILETYQAWLEARGVAPSLSRSILSEVVAGVGELLRQRSDSPEILRKKITSSRGITDALVRGFEEQGGTTALTSAFQRALERTDSLKVETINSSASE